MDRMIMERQGLQSLISPRSVAVIGASDDVKRIGGRPLRYMREDNLSGQSKARDGSRPESLCQRP